MGGLLDIDEPTNLLQLNELDALVDRYGVRKPYKSEMNFFADRPEVAGMASEDNKIVLNPFSKNTAEEQRYVAQNEALRLFMLQNNFSPNFSLTKEQKNFFKNTEYEKDENSAKQSIIARYLTNDPSIQNITQEQSAYAKKLLDMLKKGESE
jgi:hypothetical protein